MGQTMTLSWLIGGAQLALLTPIAGVDMSVGAVYPVWRWVVSWTTVQGANWMTGSGLAVVVSLLAVGLAAWSSTHPILEEE